MFNKYEGIQVLPNLLNSGLIFDYFLYQLRNYELSLRTTV